MAEHRLRLGLRLPHIPDVTEDLPMSLEILSVMRRKESCLNHGFGKETARHIRYRTMLVEWVIDVCEDFELSLTTATTAVLDKYPDTATENVTPERRAGPPQGDVEMHPATPNGKGVPSPTGPLEAWAEFH